MKEKMIKVRAEKESRRLREVVVVKSPGYHHRLRNGKK